MDCNQIILKGKIKLNNKKHLRPFTGYKKFSLLGNTLRLSHSLHFEVYIRHDIYYVFSHIDNILRKLFLKSLNTRNFKIVRKTCNVQLSGHLLFNITELISKLNVIYEKNKNVYFEIFQEHNTVSIPVNIDVINCLSSNIFCKIKVFQEHLGYITIQKTSTIKYSFGVIVLHDSFFQVIRQLFL